jgi:hypothetical protein
MGDILTDVCEKNVGVRSFAFEQQKPIVVKKQSSGVSRGESVFAREMRARQSTLTASRMENNVVEFIAR